MLNIAISLTLQENHHEELQAHLFPGDGKEAVAILLCSKILSHGRLRLLSQRIFFIPYDACHERTQNTVRWPTQCIEDALNIAAEDGLSVVKIHSHPSGTRQFSKADDKADKALFPSIDSWVGHAIPHASAIMVPDGSMIGRTVDAARRFKSLNAINVAGNDLQFWFHEDTNDNIPLSAKRITQTFGDDTYNMMRKLRIGVIGCSGTGAPIITTLNLNHIGELFMVDPGVAKDENRNRIPTLTRRDITEATPKVINQKVAVEKRGLGTKVTTFQLDICDPEAIMALASCDILIGCVDSATGRHFMNKISSCFLIPYFDLGVRIDANGNGEIYGINASMHFIKPGGSSLLSRNVYTMGQVNAEAMLATDPEEYERQKKEGYVKGVTIERPAVASINGTLSNLVVEEIMARLHGYRMVDNSEFMVRRLIFSVGELHNEPEDDFVCPVFNPLVARGDAYPLLALPLLGAAA